jgi:HAMP domain-containing protein
MQYLRTRRLVLVLAAIMIAAALVFAWLRNTNDEDSRLQFDQQERL